MSWMDQRAATGVLVVALLLAALRSTMAAPGALDRSLGGTGIVTTAISVFDDRAHALAVQADGRIVVGGESCRSGSFIDCQLAVVRYEPDGRLDPSFGVGGLITPTIGTQSSVKALALDSSGRIILAGSVTEHPTLGSGLFVGRLLLDGTLDPAFGEDGLRVMPRDEALDVAIQQDGKIVVTAGFFSVARFNEDGSVDLGFGSNGVMETELDGLGFNAVILRNGKIIAVGDSRIGPSSREPSRFLLVRYTHMGALDPTFGRRGVVVTQFGVHSEATAALVQPDGKIVATGIFFGATGLFTAAALARYQGDGELDRTFGAGGKVARFFGLDGGMPFDIAIQRDGRIVVGGAAVVDLGIAGGAFATVFGVARFNADGSVDATFGDRGVALTRRDPLLEVAPFDENDCVVSADVIRAIAIQDDGKIVAAGSRGRCNAFGSPSVFAVARYEGGAVACGDADRDGNLDLEDGIETLRAAADLSSACRANVCDVDANERLSVTDAVNVLRAAAGFEATLACRS